MENRSLPVAARLIALLAALPFSVALADSAPSPEQLADWSQRMERAQALQRQGGLQKREARDAFEAQKKECFNKFRVTDCQNEAKQEYVKALNDARRIDNEGQAAERQVKKEKLADEDARRAAEAPERAAERQAREAEMRQARSKAEQERAAKQDGQARKAAAGSRKRVEEAERIRAKQEKHARRVAEKMEKARRREAEAAE